MIRIRTDKTLPRYHDRYGCTISPCNALRFLVSLVSFSSLVLCIAVSQSLCAEPPALANIELLVVDADEKPIANAVATLHPLIGDFQGKRCDCT